MKTKNLIIIFLIITLFLLIVIGAVLFMLSSNVSKDAIANDINIIAKENNNDNNTEKTMKNQIKENNNKKNEVSNKMQNIDNTIVDNVINDNSIDDNSINNQIIDSPQNLDIIAKDKAKVSIEIKSGTLSTLGATIIITDKNISPYTWKPGYKLQMKKDGKWTDLEPLHEITFDETPFVLNENSRFEEEIDWTEDYGEVSAGDYRIVKSVYYNENKFDFFAEFIVNEA
jgi:hypothetical protein